MALATAPLPKSENHCLTLSAIIKTNFEWTIDAVSLRSQHVGDSLKSPIFFPAAEVGFKWYLLLYLGGRNTNVKDYVSLFLHSGSDRKYKVQFSFSILNAYRIEKFKEVLNREMSEEGYGFTKLILRRDLLDEKNKLVVDDRLTIYCEVKAIVDNNHIMGQRPAENLNRLQLSEDLGTLVKNNDFGDVTLEVRGKQFRAYKGILAVRSSVFAAMFRHDMQENQQNKITIDDIDQDVFSELLYFIYTNRVPKLKEIANELLEAADRYALKDLKTICEEELMLNLTVETAAKTLVLADLHCAIMLKAEAIAFINNNVTQVTKTENWQNLKENYPRLMEEALVAALTSNEHGN